MHGTYDTIENRPALRFERRLNHPVEKVWRAITEPERLKAWFPSAVSGPVEAGAELTFTFEGHDVPPMHGTVTEHEPPRRLAFYWGDDHLRFELEPQGESTVLRFTCLLDAENKAARDAAGWHSCLDRLEAALAGEDAAEDEPWRALYAEYERRGLPTGAEIPT
jgi:uncharacterized protein YndB with AHSA1/START domain